MGEVDNDIFVGIGGEYKDDGDDVDCAGEDALGWRGCFCPCITCITCILSITHSLADAINSGDAPDAQDQDGDDDDSHFQPHHPLLVANARNSGGTHGQDCGDDDDYAGVDYFQSHHPISCKCNKLRRST